MAAALGGVMAAPGFVPLALAPHNTWGYLARILGYALVFLVVRQIARRSARRVWAVVVPLIAVGAVEAFWGLTRALPETVQVAGTYYNRNHFAGLLEMTLPLALIYGIAVLHRGRQHGVLDATHAVIACALVVIALTMFAAIAASESKLGFFSALASLFVMGMLGLGRRLPRWKLWWLAGALGVLFLAAFLFLSPAGLVLQFGEVATEQSTENRLPIWKDTVHLLGAYPLFGIGAGNFFPALLRYQTSALDVAWTNAHNDYLQWLTELGLVGWALGAVLVCTVFGRAVRAAVSSPITETRLLALACTGSLTAMLIHSIGDFNTYVLSNAIVLSWVSGVAAAVASSDGGIQASRPESPSLVRRFMSGAGGLLGAYAIASLVFIHVYRANAPAERVFCRLGICDTDGAFAELRRQAGAATNDALSPEQLLTYLPRDPAAPYRWDELGAALQRAGRSAEARYAFSRAVALAPNSPPTLLTSADFFLRSGETERGLELASHSLQAGPAFDAAVFATLDDSHIGPDVVLGHVLTDRRSGQAYVRWLLATARLPDAARAWAWMIPRAYADDKLAIEYVEVMLNEGKPALAAEGWSLYVAGRSAGYAESDHIFNGDFEADPSGCRFDWRIDPTAGAAVDFDRDVRHSGARSLRIQFDGTKNLTGAGVEQVVFLKEGRYRFQADIRTQDLSTDQGVALRVVGPEAPQRLDFTTEALRGTHDWTRVERVFNAPAGGGLVRVTIVRTPSLKFDNQIRGTSWIDRVSIRVEP
jgi:O-antigen ligase/cytochrome c-type biogenesis protein CcmH/NrfG